MKLTSAIAKTVDLPTGKVDHVFWDDHIPGFGLRLRASGRRGWLLQYDRGGKTRRLTLGAVSEMDAGRARKKAEELRASIRLGGDPAGEKAAGRTEAARAAGETFGALLPAYIDRQRKICSPRWLIEVERHLGRQAKPLHGRPVAEITLRELAGLLDKVAETSGGVESNHLRGAIRAFFHWLAGKGILTTNVAAATGKAATNGKRERVLSDGELAEIWRATEDVEQFNSIVRLLMLLGLRRDEVAALRWSEVDIDGAVIKLPGSRTKSGHPHTVPLGPTAVQILQAQPRRQEKDGAARDHVFGFAEGIGFRNHDGALNLVRARIEANRRAAGIDEEMPHWVLHDLRRTVATGMTARLEIAPHIANACLHHTVEGVAGIYIKEPASLEQRRAALECWDLHLDELVAGKAPAGEKVVRLRPRRRA